MKRFFMTSVVTVLIISMIFVFASCKKNNTEVDTTTDPVASVSESDTDKDNVTESGKPDETVASTDSGSENETVDDDTVEDPF